MGPYYIAAHTFYSSLTWREIGEKLIHLNWKIHILLKPSK